MGKIQQFEHGAALRSPYMGLIHIGPWKMKISRERFVKNLSYWDLFRTF